MAPGEMAVGEIMSQTSDLVGELAQYLEDFEVAYRRGDVDQARISARLIVLTAAGLEASLPPGTVPL